jgi:ABC-type dipeptide/oligopeptide/nickel transport system permease component
LGILIGALHVVRPGGWLDHGLGAAGLVLVSVPTFWLGLMAILLFAVAFGVLLDTIVVRSILVPALSYDIGKRVWWPSRLSRGKD